MWNNAGLWTENPWLMIRQCSNIIRDSSTFSPSLSSGKLFSLTKAVKSVGCGKSWGSEVSSTSTSCLVHFWLVEEASFSSSVAWSCESSGLASGESSCRWLCVCEVEGESGEHIGQHCYDMRWQRRRKTDHLQNEHLQWLCVCVCVLVVNVRSCLNLLAQMAQ